MSVFKQCQSNTQMSGVFFFGGGEWGSKRRNQNLKIVVISVNKKLHKAFRPVRFLASFISFYFEILSYLACGEKMI